MDQCLQTLTCKSKEYATDYDILHNFNVAAKIQNCTPIQALGGMMCKHTTSVYDMITSGKEYPLSLWNEKITDHINYLLLLKTLVVDNIEKKTPQEIIKESKPVEAGPRPRFQP